MNNQKVKILTEDKRDGHPWSQGQRERERINETMKESTRH